MSADNYMFVRKVLDLYVVSMESASEAEPSTVERALGRSYTRAFATFAEASGYADACTNGENDDFGYGCEYGVRYDFPTIIVEAATEPVLVEGSQS